jgi:hypothetical protein
MSGQLHIQAALLAGERGPDNRWIRGRMSPRAGMDDVKEIKFLTPPALELRSLGRPARSQ